MTPHRPLAAITTLLSLLALPAGAAPVTPPGHLDGWTCTGVCGATGADGDITASPAGSPAYAYVTTAGSEAMGVSPLVLDSNSRGVETNGSRLVSGAFAAAAGDRLDMQFNYVSTDGKGYDDYAWARVVDATSNATVAWLFTARSSNSSTGNIVPGDVLPRSAFDPRTVIVNYDSFDFVSKTADDPIAWTPLGASNGTCWRDNAQGCGYTDWLHASIAFTQAGSFRVEVGVVNWGDGAYDSGLAFDFTGLAAAVPEPASLPLAAAGAAVLAALARRRLRSRC
jgi:hypothetical protein